MKLEAISLIEDKRRSDGNDFDFKTHDDSIERDLISPVSMGEMMGDDELDRLCDAVLTDLSPATEETARKG